MKTKEKPRFLVYHLVSPRTKRLDGENDLAETKQLLTTFGGGEIVRVIQRRDRPHKNSYIGPGKLDEIKEWVKAENIDCILINDTVKPTQLFEIEKALWKVNPNIAVWDRVDLILNIFEKHAKTSESRMQIELARMRHLGPRIFGLGMVLSDQGAVRGLRGGVGETNTELMRRHWQQEMKKIEADLARLEKTREAQMHRRQDLGLQTAAIVGYTNAGKSSLFNALTGKKKLVENALFATLDSAVGKIYIYDIKKEVLVSDTIGFIQKLPPKLIEAFKSTLMESMYADVLIHVIDIFDEHMYDKIRIVDDILADLHVFGKPQIYVFNKIDIPSTITKEQLQFIMNKYERYDPQFVSAKTGEGILELKNAIARNFSSANVQQGGNEESHVPPYH